MLNEPVVAKPQGIVEAPVLIVVQDVPPHHELRSDIRALDVH